MEEIEENEGENQLTKKEDEKNQPFMGKELEIVDGLICTHKNFTEKIFFHGKPIGLVNNINIFLMILGSIRIRSIE